MMYGIFSSVWMELQLVLKLWNYSHRKTRPKLQINVQGLGYSLPKSRQINDTRKKFIYFLMQGLGKGAFLFICFKKEGFRISNEINAYCNETDTQNIN